MVDRADSLKLLSIQKRTRQAHQLARIARVLQQVAVVAQVKRGRGYKVLAQGINRRVSYLRKELVEIVEERTVLLREYGKRGVDTHRRQGYLARLRHRAHNLVHIVPVVTQARHTHYRGHVSIFSGSGFSSLVQVIHVEGLIGNPVAVGLLHSKGAANLVVVHHAAL